MNIEDPAARRCTASSSSCAPRRAPSAWSSTARSSSACCPPAAVASAASYALWLPELDASRVLEAAIACEGRAGMSVVVVTGATGTLGGAVVERLLADGRQRRDAGARPGRRAPPATWPAPST